MQTRISNTMRSFRPFWWWRASTLALEVFSAWLAWSWAILLIVMLKRGDAHFNLFIGEIGALLPLKVWVIIFLTTGIAQSVAMCGNIFGLRYPSLTVSFLVWSFIAFLSVFTNGADITNVPYVLLALLNAWAMLRGPSDRSEVNLNERGAGAPHELGNESRTYSPNSID